MEHEQLMHFPLHSSSSSPKNSTAIINYVFYKVLLLLTSLPRIHNNLFKKLPFLPFLCYGMILILILNKKLRISLGFNLASKNSG